jgi:hypothetical protein
MVHNKCNVFFLTSNSIVFFTVTSTLRNINVTLMLITLVQKIHACSRRRSYGDVAVMLLVESNDMLHVFFVCYITVTSLCCKILKKNYREVLGVLAAPPPIRWGNLH